MHRMKWGLAALALLGVSATFAFGQGAPATAETRAQVLALAELPPAQRSARALALSKTLEQKLAQTGTALAPLDRASLQLSIALARRHVSRADMMKVIEANPQAKIAFYSQNLPGGMFGLGENAYAAVYAHIALKTLTRENAPKDRGRAQVLLASFAFDDADEAGDKRIAEAEARIAQALTVLTKESDPAGFVEAKCILMQGQASRHLGSNDSAEGVFKFSPLMFAVAAECYGRSASDQELSLSQALRLITPALLAQVSGDQSGDNAILADVFSPSNLFDLLTTARALRLNGAVGLNALGLTPQDQRRARLMRARLDRLAFEKKLATPEGVRARADFIDLLANSKPEPAVAGSPTPSIAVIAFDRERAMFGARDARGATSFTPTPGAWATQMQRDLAAARAMDTTGPTNADVAKMTELMASRAADRWNAITARADTAPTPDAQRAGLSAATEAFRGEFEPTWAPALFAAAAKAGVRPGGKLAIYPDGSSAMLPIGLLRNPKTGKALMEEYELVFAPSPSVLARAEARAAQSAAKKAALVAPAQPDLRFTPIEAAIIARGFGAAAPAASTDKSAILAGLSGASYWHFATHGGFFPEAPLDSGVLVRPVKPGAAPDFDRDVLTLRDLLSGDSVTTPRLVLLSACRTGLFNAKLTPDEFLGLPSGFLALGAAGVVSSLWSVDDVATALLIGKFYQLHLGGKRPSEALREAQIWLAGADKAAIEAFVASQEGAGGLSAAQAATLRQAVAAAPDAQQPFANPYYWGAFTFYGA